MKKILTLGVALSIATSSLLAIGTTTEAINVFSNIYKMPTNKIKLIDTKRLEANKATQYVFAVEDYPVKGIMFETDGGLYIPQNIFTKDGSNLYKTKFRNINKEYFDKQEQKEAMKAQAQAKQAKAAMMAKAPEVKTFIAEIESGKYGDLARSIKGNPDSSISVYLFTDPLCPYCQQYEAQQLPNDLKKYKEVIVVMYPLYMLQGHQTSIQRSLWFMDNLKEDMSQAAQLDILSRSGHGKAIDLKVDSDKLVEYTKMVKDKSNGIMSTGAVQGTPAVFTKEGIDIRYK